MPRRRSPLTVLAAWLITGPVGHLCAGVADWLALVRLLTSRAWARARIRARPRSR